MRQSGAGRAMRQSGAGRTESSKRIVRGPGRRRSHVILRSTKED